MGIFGVESDNTLKDDFWVLSNCVDARHQVQNLFSLLSFLLPQGLVVFPKGKVIIMLQIALVLEIKASDKFVTCTS